MYPKSNSAGPRTCSHSPKRTYSSSKPRTGGYSAPAGSGSSLGRSSSGSRPFNARAAYGTGSGYSSAAPSRSYAPRSASSAPSRSYSSRPASSAPSRSYSSPRPSYGAPRPYNTGPGSRPSFGGTRGGSSYGGGRGGYQTRRPAKNFGTRIDPSRFINKAIVTEVVEVYSPKHTFADFLINDELKASIITKGYKNPTPIQDGAIPKVLEGSDVIGLANTGTGKTAAFLIPLIHKILLNRDEQVMVIAPTRELAIQIEQELVQFTKGLKIYSVCCVGGANIVPQIRALRLHNNFVIGTPGRLKDLISTGRIVLSRFNTIVLDEADRMLDMGFVADMRFVMAGMPKDHQTLFFSATLSTEIEKLRNRTRSNLHDRI